MVIFIFAPISNVMHVIPISTWKCYSDIVYTSLVDNILYLTMIIMYKWHMESNTYNPTVSPKQCDYNHFATDKTFPSD